MIFNGNKVDLCINQSNNYNIIFYICTVQLFFIILFKILFPICWGSWNRSCYWRIITQYNFCFSTFLMEQQKSSKVDSHEIAKDIEDRFPCNQLLRFPAQVWQHIRETHSTLVANHTTKIFVRSNFYHSINWEWTSHIYSKNYPRGWYNHVSVAKTFW